MLDSNQVQGHLGGPGLRPLEGPGSRIQGLLEALGALDPGIRDPDPGSQDPWIRASGTRIQGILARPLARIPHFWPVLSEV